MASRVQPQPSPAVRVILTPMLRAVLIAVALAVLAAPVAALAEIWAPSLATDPGWEGHNNVPTDPPCKQRRQQFGFDAGGRIGGLISRSLTPASFARPVRRATFGSRLSASGRFVIDGPPYGGTLQLGWFNHASRGWRMPNSLLVRVIGPLGPKRPGQVWVSYGTVLGSGGGRLYTPGGRPLPVKLGRTYRWRVPSTAGRSRSRSGTSTRCASGCRARIGRPARSWTASGSSTRTATGRRSSATSTACGSTVGWCSTVGRRGRARETR